MDLIGSKTGSNLKAALWGEAKAFTEYSIYAEMAVGEAYPQMAHIYHVMAETEKEHYKTILGCLGGDFSPKTSDNLMDSIESEEYEWMQLYRKFTQEAEEEGFDDIAEKFLSIALAERDHEAVFRRLLTDLQKSSSILDDD